VRKINITRKGAELSKNLQDEKDRKVTETLLQNTEKGNWVGWGNQEKQLIKGAKLMLADKGGNAGAGYSRTKRAGGPQREKKTRGNRLKLRKESRGKGHYPTCGHIQQKCQDIRVQETGEEN